MRQWFAHLQIRGKLQVIVVSTACVSLLVAAVMSIAGQVVTSRRDMVENLTTLAYAIGKNSAVALTFDDQNLAYEVLGGIPVDSEIKRATLYRPDGVMFVHRDFDSEQAFDVDDASVQWITQYINVESASYQFTNLTQLHLLAPITYEDERLGSIYIQSGLRKLNVD